MQAKWIILITAMFSASVIAFVFSLFMELKIQIGNDAFDDENHNEYKATPINCLDLDDQFNLIWRLAGYYFYVFHQVLEKAPFLSILKRRAHFTGNVGEEAPFYWVKLGGGQWSFYYWYPKTMLAVGGWFHFLLSKLYLEGWRSSCRLIYLIGVSKRIMLRLRLIFSNFPVTVSIT